MPTGDAAGVREYLGAVGEWGVEAGMIATNPLIPRDQFPTVCRDEACRITMVTWPGLFGLDGCDPDCAYTHAAHLVHARATGRSDALPIAHAMLDDVELDIWGDQVRPWIERLHQEEPS